MPRFYLHLRNGHDEVLDHEGVDYRDLKEVVDAVLKSARDVISGDVMQGRIDLRFRIDAEDADGNLAYSLPFAQAVTLISNET
jgi:hypothetical protein